jgi:uncharacterized membrane protein
MSSQIGRAGFQIGVFVVFVSGLLLFFLEQGSAEHTITLFTLVVGLIFLATITILVRLGQRNP